MLRTKRQPPLGHANRGSHPWVMLIEVAGLENNDLVALSMLWGEKQPWVTSREDEETWESASPLWASECC